MFSTLQDKSFKKRAIFAEGEEWPVDDSCPLHKPVNFIGEKGGGEEEGGIDRAILLFVSARKCGQSTNRQKGRGNVLTERRSGTNS